MKLTDKKLINRTVIALYFGENIDWKLGCTRNQMKALSEALVATKGFELVLMNESTTVSAVSEALQTKHVYAQAFQREFGQPWPL